MPEFSDEYWMRHALELAQQADQTNEVPVGAIVVKGNAVIAEGFNQPISSADPTAHAEIVALRGAAQTLNNYRLPDTTLYVTVEPCAMCAGAIIHSRIKRVVYGAAEPKAGAVCSHLQLFDQAQMNHRVEWQGGVLADEATAVLQAFFARRRNEKRALKKG
ncbi:tRNA adenosine(34) deaminase TadA [Zhongshania aliphaticivorans]|uniref:tRNA-specific adenosine deaminase n=1 Tax=Zhongshania aliphaticivorans TaxID=1470434 RepID=A0A127M5X0_9GAMM|nr:tRNA adenosine(34) deaminase TadA [Zhongshania aliphaticivorans]AMO68640.1 zinc-binding protein [Zhongshania aliphaticivorans]